MLHVREELDGRAMDAAIQRLQGEHDFAAFGSVEQGSTVRNCYHAQCRSERRDGRRLIVVEIAASGFLKHMVRSIVGTLILVGRGKLGALDMDAILESRDRSAAGPTAPPHGLYLESVRYAGDEEEDQYVD